MLKYTEDTCYVYVLGAAGADYYRTYVGWTTNLLRRLDEHNSGNGARFTRGRNWKLLYAERHSNRKIAMSREWQIKQNRKFRKQLVNNQK